MSTEPRPTKPRTQPSEVHFNADADDIPQTFGPYTDTEKELARQRQELAQMRDAETRRKKRNRIIGGSTLAGLVLAGGGVFAGSRLGGGEAEPGPEPTEPGVAGPENPGEEPVDVPFPDEVEPAAPGDNGNTPPTSEQIPMVGTEQFLDFSNEEILEAYKLDGQRVLARSDYVPQFVAERGMATEIIDGALWTGTYVEESYSYAAIDYREDGTQAPIFPQTEKNLVVLSNLILANPEEVDGVEEHLTYRIINGATEPMLREVAIQGIDCPTDCVHATDSTLVNNLINEMSSLPEGSVVTDFNLMNFYLNDVATDKPGTIAIYNYRDAQGEEHINIPYHVTDITPTLERVGVIAAGKQDTSGNWWTRYDDDPRAEVYFKIDPDK